MKLVDLALDRPVATLMLLLGLTVLGAVAIVRIPLDFMPAIDEPEVEVEVPFPGAHPLESLKEVAVPIEEEIATIPGVRGLYSHGNSGRASIDVQFDWSANIDLKKLEVREAVERARRSLPEGIGHITISGDQGGPGGGGPGMILQGRISATRDLSESWDLLDRRIRRPLERIKGVARVDLYGVEPLEVRVDLDLDALRRHGIQPGEVLQRLEAANLDLDLGAVRGDVVRYTVRAESRFRDVETVRNLPLRDDLRIRDVASVVLREPRLPYGRHLDRRFAIGIDVYKEPAANTVATVDQLLERIGEIEKDPALAGITLLVWQNAGEQIRLSIAGLRDSGIFGGALAVLVLFAFLRRVRTTLIVGAAIPFSLIVTCGAMYLLGMQFNVLSMLGLMLGVGMLVDNAIVVIENIHRQEGRGLDPERAARLGAGEVALAVLAATATTVVVWSWLFVAEQNAWVQMMSQVAIVVCLAISSSLLIALTFIPFTAARFPPRREVRPGFLLRKIVPGYRAVLAFTLRHRFLTLFALFLMAASVVLPWSRIEMEFEPTVQEVAVRIQYEVHDPSTKEVMEGYVDRVEEVVVAHRDRLGYESLYSWYEEGGGGGGGMTMVYLPRDRATDEGIARLKEQLRDILPTIAGVSLKIGDRMWWQHRGGRQGRIPVAIHGDDPEYLETLARDVEKHLATLPHLVDIYGPSQEGRKEVRLAVDPDKTRALGLTPQEVARGVALAFRGRQLRRFHGPDGEVEMLLGLPEEERPGLATLTDLTIPRADGTVVPLGSVAEVEMARTAPQVMREDRMTTVRLTLEFDEDEVNTDEAQAMIARRMDAFRLPVGYAWSWGRWGEERDEGFATLALGVAMALVVVFLLMAALFESFSQPLAIVITLPLAFFGGFWLLWILGFRLDAVAAMGLIILIGVVVNNGIVMVDHVNNLRRRGIPRVEAMIEGCGDRLRPVLMTAITTIFGLLPLAMSAATVANAYIDSLAVVVIGGLTTSAVFTLLALPVWYTIIEDGASILSRLLPVPRAGRFRPPRGGVLAERPRG